MITKTDCYFFSNTIDDISKEDWNDCVGLDHPFTRYEFFQALEKSGSAVFSTGWIPFHYIQINLVKIYLSQLYNIMKALHK